MSLCLEPGKDQVLVVWPLVMEGLYGLFSKFWACFGNKTYFGTFKM